LTPIAATSIRGGVADGVDRRDGRRFLDALGNEVPFTGTSPLSWRLSAYVLAVRDGKVLMVRQGAGVKWELPGGRVEVEEALLEAAERECHEETGYRFVAASSAPLHLQESWFFKRGSASFHHAVVFVFQGVVEGDVDPAWTRNLREIGDVRWLDPSDLSTANTHPFHWPPLRKARLV
jgi:8-oxo-dGTP pyrophosphatase MutT (NUDIX family)